MSMDTYLWAESTVSYMMPNNNNRAGRINGAVFATDPLNQNYNYQVNGNNQPLLGNLGRGLNSQRLLGLSSLSKNTFTFFFLFF
jgi:hypothetical protein